MDRVGRRHNLNQIYNKHVYLHTCSSIKIHTILINNFKTNKQFVWDRVTDLCSAVDRVGRRHNLNQIYNKHVYLHTCSSIKIHNEQQYYDTVNDTTTSEIS